MKKWLVVLIIFVVILTVAVACHKSSDEAPPVTTTENPNEPVIPQPGPGPAPGTPVIVFATPQQAAQGTSAVAATQALASAQFGISTALGVDAQPAGFAPSLSKSGDIGSIDPAVAAIVANMKSFATSASIQRAVKKVGALRAKAMRATVPSTTLTTDACNESGQAVISGDNTYDDPTNPSIVSRYDITFTNCKDSGDLSQTDGTLHIEQVASIDNDGLAVSLIATGLTVMKFTDDTFAAMTQKSVMDGNFISDNQIIRGANFANGSFTVTTAAQGAVPEKVAIFEYTGLEENMTLAHNPDATDTSVVTTKGTFKVTSTSGGTQTFQVTLALDLTESTISLNDAAGTRNNTLNGTVDITFAPAQTQAGCLSGKLNIATVATAPRVLTTAGGACPQEGTVTVNGATINYDPGQPIQVAVGTGTPATYADCAAFDAAGGSCKF